MQEISGEAKKITAQEWAILKNAPILSGLAIIACDFSSAGSVVETLVLIKQLKDAQKNYPRNELISSLFPEDMVSLKQEIEQCKQSFDSR